MNQARQELIKIMLSHFHRRRYPSGTTIINPGELSNILYYIAEGSVTVKMRSEITEGEVVLTYLNKGDFIGETGVFVGPGMRAAFVVTRESTVLAEIEYSRLDQLLRNQLADQAVDILKVFGQQLSYRLGLAQRKIGNLTFLDATGRIASALIDLCKQPDAMTHPDGMQIRVTRQELGRITGCSREMAGKIIKSLEEQGLITAKGKTIVVLGNR